MVVRNTLGWQFQCYLKLDKKGVYEIKSQRQLILMIWVESASDQYASLKLFFSFMGLIQHISASCVVVVVRSEEEVPLWVSMPSRRRKPTSPLISLFNSVSSILIREASKELKFKWDSKSRCLLYPIASESMILNEEMWRIHGQSSENKRMKHSHEWFFSTEKYH